MTLYPRVVNTNPTTGGKHQPDHTGKHQPDHAGKHQPDHAGKHRPAIDIFYLVLSLVKMLNKNISEAHSLPILSFYSDPKPFFLHTGWFFSFSIWKSTFFCFYGRINL